jgi:hypothetical protein
VQPHSSNTRWLLAAYIEFVLPGLHNAIPRGVNRAELARVDHCANGLRLALQKMDFFKADKTLNGSPINALRNQIELCCLVAVALARIPELCADFQ